MKINSADLNQRDTNQVQKRVLVTGADGLLGNNIVRALLAKEYQVRVFLLEGVKAPTLEDLDIEIYYGNVLKPATIDQAMKGCKMVIHAAALTDVLPSRSQIVCRVNVEGTQNIIDAVQKHQIERLVYIGSASSYAFGTAENPGDENSPFTGHEYGLDYIDSKYEAQELLLKAVREQKLPALVLAPTFMMGPYDTKPSGGAMIVAMATGKLPGYTSGGKNFVDARDVAAAAVNALTKGQIGECYIAGHKNMDYKTFFPLVGSVINKKPPSLGVPDFVIKLYGRIGSFFASLLGKQPLLSLPMAKVACDKQFFTAQKAVEELDMPQTDLKIVIADAYEWFQKNNYC